MNKKLIIFGNTEQAELAHYYFLNDSEYEITAFCVNSEYIVQTTFCGLPLIPFEEIEKELNPSEYYMFVAIGYSGINKLRKKIYCQAKTKGYKLASYISSKATIFDNVVIGDNCMILELNNLQPFVEIGNNVTIWSGNHIGHNSKIGDNCFITSHAVISGGVIIEQDCFIGVNSSIRDHIIIKKENIIGAGSIIMRSTHDKEVFIPKRTLKSKFLSDDIMI